MATRLALCGMALCLAGVASSQSTRSHYEVTEKGLVQIQHDLAAGRVTSEELVRGYEDRIASIDASGPTLRSVISVNPDALADARRLDAERRRGQLRGPLHGIPILIKDNIESSDPTATTAGSLALARNITHRDAFVVGRLKQSGAIILGKANLAEWSLIRSTQPVDGWSAIGGLVKNPYVLDHSACGSSSGTGTAIAASLAAVGVGTETDSSITCPASFSGLVGLKPTVGLISRTHVVPISTAQDTPGPMARSVTDAAILLSAMAGTDPQDPATSGADAHRQDYLAAVAKASLVGKRLGVLRAASGLSAAVDTLFEHTLQTLRDAGTVVVDIDEYRIPEEIERGEVPALLTELKAGLNSYLATASPGVTTRTLADLIRFNRQTPRELALFGQELFERAQETQGTSDPQYLQQRALIKRLAGPDGIDKLITTHHLDALIAPSYGPAYRVDLAGGGHAVGKAATLPAVAGYPHLTVPMGSIHGLPVGISFIGQAWSEAELLGIGAAFERRTRARRPPEYVPSVEADPASLEAEAPLTPHAPPPQ